MSDANGREASRAGPQRADGRSMRISASFHHHSRRDSLSSDTARVTIKKISFNPTSRRSSHVPAGGGAEQPVVSGASGQVARVFGTYNSTRSEPDRPPSRAGVPYHGRTSRGAGCTAASPPCPGKPPRGAIVPRARKNPHPLSGKSRSLDDWSSLIARPLSISKALAGYRYFWTVS